MSSETIFRTSMLEEADGPGQNTTDNPTMGEIIAARFSRRGFLKGSLAVSAIAATVSPLALIAADKARAAGGLRLHLPEVGPASTRRTTSPRATTPMCCCAGATRSSPTRRRSTRRRRPPRRRRSSSATTTTTSATSRSTARPSMACSSSTTSTPTPHLMFPGIVTIVEKDGKKVDESRR